MELFILRTSFVQFRLATSVQHADRSASSGFLLNLKTTQNDDDFLEIELGKG